MAAPHSRQEDVDRRRFLVFCRNYLVADFRDNVEPVRGEFEFEFLTDGSAPGTRDTRLPFYEALARGQRCAEIDEVTESDVVTRCRLLRNIDAAQARRMVHAMACVLATELDRIRPHGVVCHWVDEYVTHLLSILATRRGARFIAYAFSYFPGRAQLVQRSDGLAFDVREPDDAEISSTLQSIAPAHFRQDYAQPTQYSRWRHALRVARYQVKRAAFAIKSRLERDPWNLHYAVTPFIVERRRLSDFPSASLFSADWRTSLSELMTRRPGLPVAYLPLAYFPESTTDYWVADTSILDYENRVLEICRALSSRMIVVVKEHLHMLGARRPAFYAQLNAIGSTLSVDPAESSNIVLQAIDAVVMGGGSVGVEAYLRDKPVFSYCHDSFWFRPSGAFALDLAAIDGWSDRIVEGLSKYRPPAEQARREFVRSCLRSTVRTRPGARRWLLMDPTDLRQVLSAA